MLDELVIIFEADPDGKHRKPGEWATKVDEISELLVENTVT
jgi:hypothetical protein